VFVDNIKERRKAVAAKKKKELTFLKNQMENDLKVRNSLKKYFCNLLFIVYFYI
jgi:hypothetical protein